MKQTYILSILSLLLFASCQNKNSIDFTWTPEIPSAGKTISITNNSESGEDWEWTFGDESSSTSKNPKKTYMKVGTYTITLKVDGKKAWTCSKTITVVDSIPSFVCSSSVIDSTATVHIYEPITLTASIYNPYNHSLEYDWKLPKHSLNICDSTDGKSVKMAFTQIPAVGEKGVEVLLDIHDKKNDSIWHAVRTFTVLDSATEALVFYEPGVNCLCPMRQRVFGTPVTPYFEEANSSGPYETEDMALLKTAQDTIITYNNKEYSCADWGTDVLGFGIYDRRLYFRTEQGLFVRDLSGTNQVAIYTGTVHFVCVDRMNNRLYWSSEKGLQYMPLIQTNNNLFDASQIGFVNTIPDINAFAIDKTPRLMSGSDED